jgi:hypothetical protein
VTYDPDEELLFLAGELVPPGTYARVDAWPARWVVLEHSGVLPASFDGLVWEVFAPLLERAGSPV